MYVWRYKAGKNKKGNNMYTRESGKVCPRYGLVTRREGRYLGIIVMVMDASGKRREGKPRRVGCRAYRMKHDLTYTALAG